MSKIMLSSLSSSIKHLWTAFKILTIFIRYVTKCGDTSALSPVIFTIC